MSNANEGKLQVTKGMSDEEKLQVANAMLDANLDEVADLADFVNLPVGSYLVDVIACTVGMNKEQTQPVIQVRIELQETIELAKFPNVPVSELPEGEAPLPGSMTSFSFMGGMGLQKFKKVFNDIGVQLGAGTIRQIAEQLGTGSVRGIGIVTTQRASPDKVEIDPVTGDAKPRMYSELVSANTL